MMMMMHHAVVTREEQLAFELAVIYHFLTELHDRVVCTGPWRNGQIAVPWSREERKLCSTYAEQCSRRLRRIALDSNVGHELWHTSMGRASVLNFGTQKQLALESNLFSQVCAVLAEEP